MKMRILQFYIVVMMIIQMAGCTDYNSNDTDQLVEGSSSDLTKNLEQGLINALRDGNIRLLESLLEKGVSPNITSQSGSSAIVLATLNLDYRFLELMLKFGGDSNTYNQNLKRNLIFEVLGPDKRKHLKVLLSYNPYVDVVDGAINTPLIYAAILSNYKSMGLLLKKGVDASLSNRFDYSALDVVIDNESRECKNSACSQLLVIKEHLLKLQK